MSHRGNQSCRLATVWFVALVGIAVAADGARGEIGCRQPTPSPCGADGICRPNRDSWGHYHTRWRPWPGDPLPKQPTSAEEQEVDDEMRLPGLERPTAEKEDNRGPAKTKSGQTRDEGDSTKPVPALPEADLLPELDQQGSFRAAPNQDDAPPVLPRSLRKLSLSKRRPKSEAGSFRPAQVISRQQLPTRPLRAPARTGLEVSSGGGYPIEPGRSTLAILGPATSPASTAITAGNQRAVYYNAPDRAASTPID